MEYTTHYESRRRPMWSGPECTCPAISCPMHDEPPSYPDNLKEPEWIETWMALTASE